MEHIIQFGVTIDEDKIIKQATESAASEIKQKVFREMNNFTRCNYYGDSELKTLFREEIKKVIDKNKEQIIESAIERLTANLSKTKAVKEAVNNMLDSQED